MSAVNPTFSSAIDLAAVKSRQQAAWSTGNYAVVGTTLQIVGENLCEALDLRSGARVLDVAAGNGNATLAAARRWCDVTSTDYVSSLLESGRARAQAEGHTILFQEADAENLPFPDASFDVVMSTFGVMFTPNQEQAASELARVCRPGGRIGLANWTPESFIGQLFKTIGKYIPPAPGVKSPGLWGTKARLEELFGSAADAESMTVWKNIYNDIVVAAGKLNLDDELALMAHLDTMISMDSANMHFASLVNVPVVSVWGATHPFTGFMGWNQSINNAAQIELYCRPCSVFGNKPCYRGDHACMNELPPLVVVEKAGNLT